MNIKMYQGRSKPNKCDYEVYVGTSNTPDLKPLDPYFQHCNHSPTGFSWGYAGSGPAQLAFALLFDSYHNLYVVRKLYQKFKAQVIAKLPANWTMSQTWILDWINKHDMPENFTDLEDDLEQVISDSQDCDWSSRDGAIAVCRYLRDKNLITFPKEPSNAKTAA